jgi:hypothetical protein
MTNMPGAVKSCTRILWPGKALENTPRGVISPVCVKYYRTPQEEGWGHSKQVPTPLIPSCLTYVPPKSGCISLQSARLHRLSTTSFLFYLGQSAKSPFFRVDSALGSFACFDAHCVHSLK